MDLPDTVICALSGSTPPTEQDATPGREGECPESGLAARPQKLAACKGSMPLCLHGMLRLQHIHPTYGADARCGLLRSYLWLKPPQPQTIRYHRDGAEGHGRASQHWIQEEYRQRVEDPSRHRD